MIFDAGMLNILSRRQGLYILATHRHCIGATTSVQWVYLRMKASKRCHFWSGIQVDRFRNAWNALVVFDDQLIEQMKQNGVQVGYHITRTTYNTHTWATLVHDALRNKNAPSCS